MLLSLQRDTDAFKKLARIFRTSLAIGSTTIPRPVRLQGRSLNRDSSSSSRRKTEKTKKKGLSITIPKVTMEVELDLPSLDIVKQSDARRTLHKPQNLHELALSRHSVIVPMGK